MKWNFSEIYVPTLELGNEMKLGGGNEMSLGTRR
jgi:hypothetical protein